MIPINVSLSHYKRGEIQEEIIANSKNKEVAAKFNENFGRRPDVLKHKNDILELAKQGATSFHASEELWKNPLQLDISMRKDELDRLRIGWDLVIDIDCAVFDYSKIAADLIIKALKFHGVKSISCKFSGNKGFHIGVPFEAFPEKVRGEEIKNMFPEAPKNIAIYIRHMILDEFGKSILEFENNEISRILEKTGKKASEIIYEEKSRKKFNSEPILQMDTLLISPRHLYRMPYSLHEKSGLVSTPLNPEKVLMFKKEFAIPKHVRISSHIFLGRQDVEKDEAKRLFVEAFDFHVKDSVKSVHHGKEFSAPENALPEELFPPCIKLILRGVEDGRKRALFILLNYFTSIGWDYGKIEKRLIDWNAKNKEPLREVLFLSQIRYHKQNHKKILPPNCPKRESNLPVMNQQNYYTDLRVCCPDSFCSKIKNPAQYTTRKAWMMNRDSKNAKKSAKSKKVDS